MTAIQPFANKNKREEMLTAVKKIVKTAAETWRYARIELSRISAYTATNPREEEEGGPLLTIFPRIEREPLPGDSPPDNKSDMGCVYSHGQTLSKKSSAVLARRVELGEIAALPMAAQHKEEVRAEYKRPRKMSSDIATRARRFEPRPNSPLIPSIGSAQGSGEKTATVSDEEQSEMLDEQHRHGTGWTTDIPLARSDQSMRSQDIRGDEGADNTEPAASQRAYGSAAGSSPLQSPAHSRAQSPQLSRRTTATTESLSGDDEEDSEMTPKPAIPPVWGQGGGNIPGAFGAHDGW